MNLSTIWVRIMGLSLFIVGFLGLTFLITSGCILYFKQMGESEVEKLSFSLLRKLGFTQQDLLNSVKPKQLFNFGIPLLLGLCHSYFAVKSCWFLFGTEIWTHRRWLWWYYTQHSIPFLVSCPYRIIRKS